MVFSSLSFSWMAIGSLLSGLISLGFMRYLWPYRDRLGGRFFVATIGCEALWALSYGVALFVFDPGIRELFEIPIWFSINFIGVFFLAFALEYTGRQKVLRSRAMAAVVGLQALHTLVVLTNSLHHVAWSGYRIDPTFGAATVVYAHQPWLFVNAAGFILMIAVGSFLLADTVFSYGPLYRSQAAAIAVSPIFPGLPFLLWLAELGPTPPLNLTPLVFPIHLAFDMYAFFSREMFEMVPAARRTADRAAIENLGSPVVIVDSGGRIIELNDEAARLSATDTGDALGRPFEEFFPEIDPSGGKQTLSRRFDGRNRTYAVTTAPLTDASGTAVGDTIVCQDITEERQREQRLAVLNRVLRHNLRNDLNVVEGYLDIAADRVEDPEVREMIQTAARNTAGVVALGEKARQIEGALGRADTEPAAVEVRPLVEDIRDELSSTYPNASVDIDVPETAVVRADRPLLDVVFENVLENALEHNDSASPTAAIRLAGPGRDPETGAEGHGEDGFLTIAVRDDGPGIPEHELAILDGDGETALEHGSGLGLWIVSWGVDALGGAVAFESSDDGTSVFLELPTAAPADGADSAPDRDNA
ncbi:histidine kinase N-terminal 7TM domain-containing protein [Halobellus rufus]|uniref:histidine kinase N-terminal 7TM domain-containing protein n=1 Tax=Halobellus rufus TaxID=1448860 RepID=UPI0012E04E82|nr:histidine kinase N-terminal 7TM domain-containing protein [Halobellus rufus]